jgi:hypothetical protein
VPVMRLDFVSQYCTVNTFLRNWEVLTAASVKFPDATEDVRKLLNRIARRPDLCFDRELWRQFRFYALTKVNKGFENCTMGSRNEKMG